MAPVRAKWLACKPCEDHLAAGLTRLFAGTLGFLADRKLTRGLRITAEVAEWAVTDQGTSVRGTTPRNSGGPELAGLREFIIQGDTSPKVRTWLVEAEQEETRLERDLARIEA